MDLETEKQPNRGETSVNGDTGSIFQLDVLLHSEFFEHRRESLALDPEKKLMLAVLEDAVTCYQEYHLARCGERKKTFDEAADWIFGSSEGVFGFENICSVLNLDPEYIRSGLRRWRSKEVEKQNASAWKKQRDLSAQERRGSSRRVVNRRRQDSIHDEEV